ncbi:hypothetical protein FSP39_022538 [Pinctada imbricata]|uniref:Endonuclease/exonuclease/phosphatase domain-containing protein n=1 Tax=Pinctada imbricata TaxID=66713 RepID=A0AA88YJS8_PINIB|nr:hypothetical protein FSP39_022538 [Pinctada imbricata]
MDVHPNPGPIQECLTLFHLNIRSLRHKISHLEDLASDYDILCITESHLDENILDDDISIDGFCLTRRDRNAHGGGIVVYISDKIHSKRLQHIENNNIEMICTNIEVCKESFLLLTVYRPPNSSSEFWNMFESCLDSAIDINPRIVIVGDLNVDLLAVQNHRLIDIVNHYQLNNVISLPTRIGPTRASLLDPIFLRECSNDMVDVLPIDSNISDHSATLVDILIKEKISKSYKRKIFCYKDGDFALLNSLISEINWAGTLDENSDIDVACEIFNEKITTLSRRCIPTKIITFRNNDKPWFNSELRREIRIRNRMWKKAKKSGSPFQIDKYKHQRNKVNNMKKHAREVFFLEINGIIDNLPPSDPNGFWKLVNLLTKNSGTSSSIPPLLNPDNNQVESSDQEKADILNNYFSSISNINDANVDVPDLESKTNSTLSEINITTEDFVIS